MSQLLQERTLQYHRQRQSQPGWFDLVNLMVGGMLDNAGEQESQAFLRQMGDKLAGRYPLDKARTVADLEENINKVLDRFNWGFVCLQAYDGAMVIDHSALPAGDGVMPHRQWRLAMGAVLLGLYARWLRGQGGSERVGLNVEETGDCSLRFRYQV
ncbi:cellulose biosynthesis protein BcsD [Erwinia pyrifoliae]|uniref:Cellulose synthase n=1 Tax=Erwinia pyrifoliae TaxID=79967 RepID=A0ABY5X8D2_ERWPY|nr:cellulose biosynthesis protein BcsD [Erwinia pyrifoliae]AUX71118.1 cellulose synthase [Erwinia pyrifoliae]MCA8875171.1 cellulose synthase [Erwinia pyrifoliae]MCT2385511.1 cellulose synthase [Erwinia pyrifoliae]MCU8588916.1 cellulose synthase [Erwinia pyrifoliae]UWS29264.1 cellulose synthase [Erwinia pyrifoliae]